MLSEGEGLSTNKSVQDNIFRLVKDHFSPEFVNRVDDLIMFNRLSREHMDGILDIRLKEVHSKLSLTCCLLRVI